MNTFTKNLYAMIAIGLVSGSASAKDLYLSANGNDSNSGVSVNSPRATLTSLNDIIEAGDVIHVSGMIDINKEIPLGDGAQDKNSTWGHYISYNNGNHNGFYINGSNTSIDGKASPWKEITIMGKDPEVDGFDGGESTRIFYVRGDNRVNTVTFKNLTLRNGLAPKEGGGAIFIHDNGWVEVENCVFDNNHLDYEPLTEEEHSSGNIKLKNSNSERGGAINFQFGKLTIADSKFTNNHNRRGGALIATGGVLKVTRTLFEGNGADINGKFLDDSRGGAVHLWPLNTEITATFDHCDFIGNTTWNNSGALYLQSNTDSSNLLDVVFTNCSFIQNRTVDGQGGAAFVNNAENYSSKDDKVKNIYVTFANTSFLFNEAKSEGGAVFMSGGIQKDELRMVNCTIAKNTTLGNAGHGAGYCEGIANNTFKPEDTDRYFYNCLVEYNEAPGASGGKGEYSDLLPFGYFTTDNSYYGRIVFTKVSEQDFFDGLEAAGINRDNVWHAENSANFGDEKNTFLISDNSLNGYEWSYGKFRFMTLEEGAEQLEAGNPKYLTLAPRKVTAPNGKEFNIQGYDISESDQMGFKRKEGKCAIGAMEASTQEADEYYDDKDFPYLGTEEVTPPASINEVVAENVTVEYSNDVVTARGSDIVVYDIYGRAVASANDCLNISNLPKGVYVIKASGNGAEAAVKVLR